MVRRRMTPTVPASRSGKGHGDDGSARNRIRAYRIAAGLTQQQLARTAGISIGVVRDLEQGRTTRLRTGSADALTRAFGFDDGQAREFSSTVRGRTVVSSTAAG